MIRITMKNGYDEWEKEQYTEYKYDGKFFIICDEEKWVGLYNLDNVLRIVIDK